jgi:hypothetical protein
MRLVDAASMPLTHDTSLARCSSRDPRRLCSAIGIRANLSRREVALPCSGAFATFRQRVRFVRRPLLGSRGRRRNWGSGYRAKITLTSSRSTPTTGWTVGVSLDGSQMTGAELSSVSPRPPTSGPVTITNLSWNAAVSSSSSVSFGFNGSGSGRPTVTSVTYTGGGGTGGTGGTSGSGGTGGSTGATGGSGGSGATGGSSSGTNPFAGTTLYVDNDLQACRSSSTAARAI